MTKPVDDTIRRLLASIGKLPPPLPPAKSKRTYLIKGNMRDERTFAQLQHDIFSGIRANDMWLRFEIWIVGRLAATLTYSEFFSDPDSLNRCYAETFGIDIVFTAGALHDIKRLKERKILLSDTDIQKALQMREDDEKKEKRSKS